MTLLVLATTGTALADGDEKVKVRLFSGQVVSSLDLSDARGDRLTIYDSSGPLATLEEGQTAELTVWNEFLRAKWRSGSVPMDRALVEAGSGTITVTVNGESRSYRGSIEVALDGDIERPGLVIVNEVRLPDYVSSVLPSEYGFAEPEGLKAQAIVIRTYALRARSQRQGLYDLTDDTGSQVYLGVSSETELARAAVQATSGMTITHDGNLIEAVYSAHCGGHSADNEDVWSSRPVSYLRGREDPYDAQAPVARWESRIKKKELLELFSRNYGSDVKNIDVSERGAGGRATMIRLDAKSKDLKISAQSFRVAVNGRFGPTAVKSTFFDIEEDGDSYRFAGRGLGHGVGLCQWGTAAQAREGRSYRDILSFYYKDVEIEGYESDFQVASAPLADAGGIDRPRPKTGPDEPVTENKIGEPTSRSRERPVRSSTSRKLTGRRVGW